MGFPRKSSESLVRERVIRAMLVYDKRQLQYSEIASFYITDDS